MKQKQLIKILLILIVSIFFTACNDNKKENGYKATLPMPSTKGLSNMGVIGLAHDAKQDPIPATKIGYAYSEELKDYDKAIQWYKYSNSMKPMPQTSNYMCYAYQMKKEYDEAINWCKNAIELGSDKALVGLGSAYNEINEHQKAIEYYQKAYNKKLPEAANNIGNSYSFLKKFNKAEEWYKIAIKEGNLASYQSISTFYHEDIKDNLKASAYAISVINTKYTKKSVLKLLQKTWEIPNETIKKGYELQLNSPEFPIKYQGDLGL